MRLPCLPLLVLCVIFCSIVFALPAAHAQQLTPSDSFTLAGKPLLYALDISQRIYVAEAHGIIRQYDSTGRQGAYYSPPKVAAITVLEARFGVRVYAFYQDLQQFTIFNRFLQPIETHTFNPTKIGFAQQVAWSADQTLWIWDSQEAMLKKYNPLTEEVKWQVNILPIFQEQDVEISKMQEYENRLYIFDKNQQVWVFDYFGNFLQTFAATPLACLYGEMLWDLTLPSLQATSLYESKEKKQWHLPLAFPAKVLFLCVHHEKILIFENNKVTIWKL